MRFAGIVSVSAMVPVAVVVTVIVDTAWTPVATDAGLVAAIVKSATLKVMTAVV